MVVCWTVLRETVASGTVAPGMVVPSTVISIGCGGAITSLQLGVGREMKDGG